MALRVAGISIALFLILICVLTLVNAQDAKKPQKVSNRQPNSNEQRNAQEAKRKEESKYQHIQHIPSLKEKKQQKQSQQAGQTTTTQELDHAEGTRSTQPRKPRAEKLIQFPEPEKFECESEGFQADPYNCSIFHLCVEKQGTSQVNQNQSLGYITITFQCNADFLYDLESNSCINVNDSSRAIECSNQTSRQSENEFRFSENNENEKSTQSPPLPPKVKYVTDKDDDRGSGNGIRDGTTLSNRPPKGRKSHPSNTTPKNTTKPDTQSPASMSPSSDNTESADDSTKPKNTATRKIAPKHNSSAAYRPPYGRAVTPRSLDNPRQPQSTSGNTNDSQLPDSVPQNEGFEENHDSNNQSPVIYILSQLPRKTENDANEPLSTTQPLPPIVVPTGRKPVVRVIRRKKPANDFNEQQEPRQAFGKSTPLPSSRTQNVNENNGRIPNNNSPGQKQSSTWQSTSPTAHDENVEQRLPHDGNSNSEKAPVIYVIAPTGSLQNSNLLPPQSGKSSPKQSYNGESASNDHPVGKFGDGNADANNEEPQVHLPVPPDTSEPSIYLLPPRPEIPEESFNVKKTENNDDLELTEPNYRRQAEKNPSRRPQLLLTTTSPRTVRTTSYRTHTSTTMRDLFSPSSHSIEASSAFDSQNHLQSSFDFTPELGQQQPPYNQRPDSPPYNRRPGLPPLLPARPPAYPPTNAQSYPQTNAGPQSPPSRFGSQQNYGGEWQPPQGANDKFANSGLSAASEFQNTYSNNNGNVDPTEVQRRTNNGGSVYSGNTYTKVNNYPTSSRTPLYKWNQFSSSSAPSINYYDQEPSSVQTGQSFGTHTSYGPQEKPKKQERDGKTSKVVCVEEGFYPIQNDCKHFYRCVGGGGGFSKYTFSCSPGTVYDPDTGACNHRWATYRQDC